MVFGAAQVFLTALKFVRNLLYNKGIEVCGVEK